MEGKEKLKYLIIPDEATHLIEVTEGFKIDNSIFYDDATCICFDIKNGGIKALGDISKQISETYDKDFKYAIFADDLTIMPYTSGLISYVKIKDGLYMNISDNMSDEEPKPRRWIDITKRIKTDFSMLDPMAVFYFEEFEEMKNKNKQVIYDN